MDKWRNIFNPSSVFVPLGAIVLGLLSGAVIMLLGGYNPVDAYQALFRKVFGSPYDIGETIRTITPLLFTGLAVGFTYRAGLFNIGADGQYIMGMTGAAIVGIKLQLPWFIHAPLAVLVGAIFGGLWAALVGYLKASRGVNEVISSIMLNWIALYLSNYLLRALLLEPGQQRSYFIHESASVSIGWLSRALENARMDWGIFIGLIGAIVFYFLLWRTKQGYELRAVGLNPDAARYAGINIKSSIVKSMFIGGVFAGLGGVFEVLGVFHYQVLSAASSGYGFDGIAVALLGGNHPVGIVFASILFGTLTYGSAGMNFSADVPTEIVRIVIGAVIFFVASHGIIQGIVKPFMASRRKLDKKGAA
ncbi:ABC transporter permease [Paenibacillus sambharensis]|uniref:ABC transporter permease n=1 Tax=Paenibacillus sambharensis TaxID=1803190 RepID=A0A2W1LI22_9BACL|nr:ABC transporter permease [Paenibacillus sambharensis]PZD97660.1 ABC transporter permease [Paenibacillus sambharensis]